MPARCPPDARPQVRFNRTVRIVGALSFLLRGLIYMGFVLYAPALALEAVARVKVWFISGVPPHHVPPALMLSLFSPFFFALVRSFFLLPRALSPCTAFKGHTSPPTPPHPTPHTPHLTPLIHPYTPHPQLTSLASAPFFLNRVPLGACDDVAWLPPAAM